jgi:hypothetical protein
LYEDFRDDMITLGITKKELAAAEKERRVPKDLRTGSK